MKIFRRDTRVYLQKKRMNLCVANTFAGINLNVLLIAALIIVVLAFGKFAVYDRLKAVSNASQTYYDSLATLDELNLAAASYDDIQERYSRFGQNYKTEDEAAFSDRMAMLTLIENDTNDLAELKSISIQDNTATITLDMDDYQNAAILRDTLAAEDKILSVSSETAEKTGAETTEKTEMTLVITFCDEGVAEQ